MKTALLAILVLYSYSTNAKTYYISSNLGDDKRTAAQAQNSSTPWKTISKLDSFFSSLQPGDSVLLERGSVFYGTLKINKSGTSSQPIVIDAYGKGAPPLITGFTSVSSWKNVGKNIWESTSAISKLSVLNVVTINGINTPMGRYPNTGFLTYQTFSGNTSIKSSSLKSDSVNWTGAELVIKKRRWLIDRNRIKLHSGDSIAYYGGGYEARNNYGFFIQNDSKTLDKQNEWFYKASTKKIRIYSSGNPGKILASTLDTLVSMTYSNYITIKNISFKGANSTAFWIGSCSNLIVKGCRIDFSNNGIVGEDFGGSSANFMMQNSVINQTNNNAIALSSEFTSAIFTDNLIKNTGLIPGAGESGDGTYNAVSIHSPNCVVKNNIIDSVGYNGIAFFGSSINVSNNLVNNYCMLKSDGGGIYTQGINNDLTIVGNVVINGNCKDEGVFNPVGISVIAIYLDGTVSDIKVLNNSVGNVNHGGIYLHNPTFIEVKNNTVYNCGHAGLLIKNDEDDIKMRNLVVTKNIFFARDSLQRAFQLITLHNDIPKLGIIDSNYYARPIDDSLVFGAQAFGEDIDAKFYDLSKWKSYARLDAHSLKSPKKITNLNDLKFVYNATSLSKTISLDAKNYIDVTGKSYPETITLAPYSSAVLIKNGTTVINRPPVANAGSNQTIQLPNNKVNTNASAVDPDGFISTYSWTKVSGPASYAIASASSLNTSISNLEKGTYYFQLQVADNKGKTDKDTVKITVKAPLASAKRHAQINITSVRKLTAYPNPFRYRINIQAGSAERSEGTLEVFDLEGKPVQRIFHGMIEAGISKYFIFEAKGLPAGIYIIRLTTGTKVISRRITLLK